ncbi:hypothetical protein [Pontibacter rugosus]|uniref:Uncharacterized protein n=1 Tax=Pontibacter rugosus TaxID=1745966 RepID=A0ABW3ST89_9BACT
MERYTLLLSNKYIRFILMALAAMAIYQGGKSVGEFAYYVTH